MDKVDALQCAEPMCHALKVTVSRAKHNIPEATPHAVGLAYPPIPYSHRVLVLYRLNYLWDTPVGNNPTSADETLIIWILVGVGLPLFA